MAFKFCCHGIMIFVILAATINISPASAVEEFKVGDIDGWRQPDLNHTEMYTRWAATKRFHVGDSLRFEYTNDSVLVVDKWAYYHCNTTSPSSIFTDGNTTINLDNVGPLYFISGDSDHCDNGQRLAIEVMTLHPHIHKSPPPSSPPAPEPEATVSPAPSAVSTSGTAAADHGFGYGALPSSVLVATFATLLWHST